MGRKKLTVKKIDDPNSRQMTYSRRRDSLVKKAKELGVLCDVDIALLMFSPTGGFTSFASKERIEDVLLRFVELPGGDMKRGPIFNKGYLSQKLKQLKCENEMLEKITKIEALEEKLGKLKERQLEAKEKMRFYNPNVENIQSVLEAQSYQQYLSSAIQNIQLSKAMLGQKIRPQNLESYETTAVEMEDVNLNNDEPECSNRKRSRDKRNPEAARMPMGPHLSLSFIQRKLNGN